MIRLSLKGKLTAVCSAMLSMTAKPAASDTFGSGANTFDIEFVTIGNPGNAADTTGNPNLAGSVAYTYRMGKFEISEQMIDKANTLGGLGITKDTRGPDKPATSVSWNEAARFVNWLNTSTGSTPAYKFALQPGEVGYNANANIRTVDDRATPATTRTISTATAWRGIFCPASMSGTRRRTTIRPAASITTTRQGATRAPTPVASGTAAGTAVYGQYRHLPRPCGHHARRGTESLRDDGPGRQCLGMARNDL